jgi:hypothetical protein
MKTSAKGQSAMEFVVLASFMLLVILGFFAITTSRMFEAKEQMEETTAQQIADIAFREIELASTLSDGYTRVFSIPRNVNGVGYNITIIDDRELVVVFEGFEHIKFFPTNVTGNITKGMNQLRKEGNVIYLSTVQPECDNEEDDDSDSFADEEDPGCYLSCNYLESGNYVKDWAERDSCRCSHIGTTVCCAGIGIGTEYSLLHDTCALGECWTNCYGPSILTISGLENSVFFLSDGNMIIRGVVYENIPASASSDDELVLKNVTGTNVAVMSDTTGDVKITGGFYENQMALPAYPANSVITIKESSGETVAFINDLGDLYIKGNLTENGGSILS